MYIPSTNIHVTGVVRFIEYEEQMILMIILSVDHNKQTCAGTIIHCQIQIMCYDKNWHSCTTINLYELNHFLSWLNHGTETTQTQQIHIKGQCQDTMIQPYYNKKAFVTACLVMLIMFITIFL